MDWSVGHRQGGGKGENVSPPCFGGGEKGAEKVEDETAMMVEYTRRKQVFWDYGCEVDNKYKNL